jgi:hypothetical protein
LVILLGLGRRFVISPDEEGGRTGLILSGLLSIAGYSYFYNKIFIKWQVVV